MSASSSSSSSWMKDIHERVRRASNDVNIALQPRVAQAKRSLEAGIQQIGLTPGPEIFHGDEALSTALHDLDQLRHSLRLISAKVASHRARLLDLARVQAALSNSLLHPPHNLLPLLRNHLPNPAVDVQPALANAQTFSANALSRFALDMGSPMSDLARTLDEALASKITPLKKRYIAQRVEYERYARQAADADDDLRRSHLSSIADSALPAWRGTADTLLAEVRSLLAYSTAAFSDWTLNVAQAQSDMYHRCARAFEQPSQQAEAVQNAPPSPSPQ